LTPKPPAHDAFLTTEEVLKYLQVNLRTVYRLIKSKSIPAVRVGRQWRFKVKQIKPALPIIIITGYSTEKSAIEAVNLRVAGYLTKPLRDRQVLEAAARALGAPAA
jgi:excisionase family DNA binding protein